MTQAELQRLIDGLAPVIKEFVQREITTRATNVIEALAARVCALESRPQMKFCGLWRADSTYQRGDFVGHAGSLWHCTAETTQVPGEGQTNWTLYVQRGREGRPGKDLR